ncbi:hypothetical protein [Anaerorhabdus sp.]|uniref:hypothetical protein n=1 Tax=Anaerorhabdus sp. TaxID=1872524 RepID=UPI002B21D569|nr:hypothetical protein [Anaerorhabdus sp.]MEA4874565.1 hypothetical protein [Anaerorhabdus sp.]
MKDKRVIRDILEGLGLFIAALSEMILLFFYSSFNNTTIITIILIIIPILTVCYFYYKYRKSHYRQIYTDEELKNQHR